MKSICIKEYNGKWYLFWYDTGRTIAAFHTQFEAYAARRDIENKITLNRKS